MNFKALVLILGLGGSANAAGISYKLPGTIGNIIPVIMPGRPSAPMILPTVDAVIAVPTIKPALTPTVFPAPAPISLPSLPVPAIGQARLPGVPSPLPLPAPAILTVVEAEVLDLSVPQTGALNELRDATFGREPIRVSGAKLFDGARETTRATALPADRFF